VARYLYRWQWNALGASAPGRGLERRQYVVSGAWKPSLMKIYTELDSDISATTRVEYYVQMILLLGIRCSLAVVERSPIGSLGRGGHYWRGLFEQYISFTSTSGTFWVLSRYFSCDSDRRKPVASISWCAFI
jgi:hypothetical protein